MSFRCIFIIRQDETDVKDLQPFCYKAFDNCSKRKRSGKALLPLSNFNEWYFEVFKTLKDGNYTAFSENNINKYLSNPLFGVQTKFGIYYPCIIIIKKKYAFGGLVYNPNEKKRIYYGNCVDFIINMSVYFLDILNNNKVKMSELLPEFYQYIRTLCPYGTPRVNSSNLVELLKQPDNLIKQIQQSCNKIPLPIDQLNIAPNTKPSTSKEIKCHIQEIVTCVQHENRSGEPKYDTDILGEFHVICSGFSPNDEIVLRLQLGKSNPFMNSCIVTDLIIDSSNVIKCAYKTPVTVLTENEHISDPKRRHSTTDYTTISEVPLSTTLLSTGFPGTLFRQPSSLVGNAHIRQPSPTNSLQSSCSNVSETPSHISQQQKHKLNREPSISYTQLSRRNSVHTNTSETIDILFLAPIKSDTVTLFKYRLMCCKEKRPSSNAGFDMAFIKSLRIPRPPLFCTYQLEEDHSTRTAQLIFKINMNPDLITANSAIEFSKLDILFPFPNRPPLLDVSKCNASNGKHFIMEQNRRIMFWNIGTNIKFKSEISLVGQIKFKQNAPVNEFVDKFSVPPNAHAQVNFALKSTNLSGLTIDPNCAMVNKHRANVKLISKTDCQSFNYKVWNCLGDCSMEMI